MSDTPVEPIEFELTRPLGPGLVRCACADDCNYVYCVTCGGGDCKWPGACKGKCAECGAPARPLGLPNSEGLFGGFCGQACSDVHEARGRADGTIVDVADITPERLNAELNRGGLGLRGVGPLVAS